MTGRRTRRLLAPLSPLPPTVLVWSHRSNCCVCRGSGRIRFAWLGQRLRGRGVAACPHCPTDPARAVPIPLPVPTRHDQPKKDGAA